VRDCRGFTVFEVVVALTMMVVVMVLAARAGVQARLERARLAARQQALTAASNLLEAARACPWDDLTLAWAQKQRLSEATTPLLHDARLEVRVEPEASPPRTKRVTVAVRWDFRENVPPQEVQLVTLFSARESAAKAPEGGRP
jgi:hypothetical protein